MEKLLAYASQSNQLAAYAAAAPAMDQAASGAQQPQDPSLTSGASLPASPAMPSPPQSEGSAAAPDSRRETRNANAAPGPSARFESLDGLYQRIAASAAGGGSDEQASQANVETARNTSLILQALEAQNRLLEKDKGPQSQQILWQ